MSDLALRVRGCRGSMSVSGPQYRRYGGNTTCFEVAVSRSERLVVDCGTGLRGVQHELPRHVQQHFTVLLTHYHWDHVQGIPVFAPLFDGGHRFDFHGPGADGDEVRHTLGAVIRPPWFPVALGEASSATRFHALDGPIRVGPLTVRHVVLTHPQGVAAYRIDSPDRSVVIATDHESGDADADRRLEELARGADVLIHDGQYTPDQTATAKKGWGHSTWRDAVEAARAAGVGRLVLTSHDPDRFDEEVDAIRGMARGEFPRTDAAYEGMTIGL